MYVVYGLNTTRSYVNLAAITPNIGYVIYGAESQGQTGYSVAVGDVNADGIEDIVIGAPYATSYAASGGSSTSRASDVTGVLKAGIVHVVYGISGSTRTFVDLMTLAPSVGYSLSGNATGQLCGWSVAVGRVNGDVNDDVVIGCYGGSPNGRALAGVVCQGHNVTTSWLGACHLWRQFN